MELWYGIAVLDSEFAAGAGRRTVRCRQNQRELRGIMAQATTALELLPSTVEFVTLHPWGLKDSRKSGWDRMVRFSSTDCAQVEVESTPALDSGREWVLMLRTH
eukprot:COSAG02_NODE_21130_length_800_cov_42255.019971_1_plen_104_part_00